MSRWRMAYVLAGCVLACSAVPDVHFVDPSSDGGTDAGRDAPGDGALGDGGSCSRLQVADVCCDSVTCRGDCTSVNCSACAAKCKVDELCCAKSNNVVCKSTAAPSCN